MKAYELLFFVNPSLDDEARAGVMKRIDSTIVENGGAVESVEDWGKRKLAYTIDKLTEGDYTLINFQLDPACIAEAWQSTIVDATFKLASGKTTPTSSIAPCSAPAPNRCRAFLPKVCSSALKVAFVGVSGSATAKSAAKSRLSLMSSSCPAAARVLRTAGPLRLTHLRPSSRILPRMPLLRSSNIQLLQLCRPQTRFMTRRFRSRNPQPISLRI